MTDETRAERTAALRVLFAQAIFSSKEPDADPKKITEWLVGELKALRLKWEAEDPPWDESAGAGEQLPYADI